MKDNTAPCPCGQNIAYSACCELIHLDHSLAKSAEQLMRARFSAFALHRIDFIYNTFHPSVRFKQSKKEIEEWAISNKWLNLEIVKATTSTVEFKAYYLDENLNPGIHHEKSEFKLYNQLYFYINGKIKT